MLADGLEWDQRRLFEAHVGGEDDDRYVVKVEGP